MSGAGAWMRAVMVFALCGIGAVASFAARHPLGHTWSHAVRQLVGGPAPPVNPPRRRGTFTVATVWLALVGTLFAAGASTAPRASVKPITT